MDSNEHYRRLVENLGGKFMFFGHKPDGEIVSYVAVKRDISRELKVERQLYQAQKMEAIGTLAGGIAHDFNNILGAIFGYTELSLDLVAEQPLVHGNLEQVLIAANRARDLIKQILTISRQAEQEVKQVNVTPMLKEVVKFMRASLPTTIRIGFSLTAERDLVSADPTQLHQVLMNLCTNAGHAMRDRGGSLELTLQNVVFGEGSSDAQHLATGEYLLLSVSDTGHGIPGDALDRIFDPYYTTKGQGEGTGLGLAVVHGIVKSCGGDVRVYSELEKGTVFHVYLPLAQPGGVEDSARSALILAGTEHILFIDDELPLVDSGVLTLGKMGYAVEGRTNPREAIDSFRKNPAAYDLIITDKTMPEMTGFDLLREMRCIRDDVPVILCTGFMEDGELECAWSLGFNNIALKPLDKAGLSQCVRDALEFARAEKQGGA